MAAAAAGRGGHDLDEAVEEAEENLVDGEEAEEADGYVYDCRGMEVASHDEAEAEEWKSLWRLLVIVARSEHATSPGTDRAQRAFPSLHGGGEGDGLDQI